MPTEIIGSTAIVSPSLLLDGHAPRLASRSMLSQLTNGAQQFVPHDQLTTYRRCATGVLEHGRQQFEVAAEIWLGFIILPLNSLNS